ncbi:MAG: GGDEF domain-containing protein, partial [Bacilli bacterium]|nr:GGDEF domain-containing protein [Bacilli bacterium]
TISDDKTFRSIMNKFNMVYEENSKDTDYKKYFLSTIFKFNDISEAEKMSYNATAYTYGYIPNMPFESTVNKEFVGVLSNYLSGFEDLVNVDFKIVEYNNVNELKQALSHGEVDLIFDTFNPTGINVDILKTNSPFREEYVVLSKEPILVNSIRSLKGSDIYTISNTYIYDYLTQNGITPKAYDNSDMLLRNIRNESIVMIDRDTYEYYKDNKFKSYKVIYQNTLGNDYSFVIRDVSKNETFYKLFNYYVSSVNYKSIKYDYNTNYVVNSKNEISSMLKYLFIILGVTFALLILFIIILKMRSKKRDIPKEDKMKFIDVMTSLKNRNYLNYNIKTWDDNVIYPQAIVIIDLNNVKYINDNYGHTEGDEVIKRAAGILIDNQQENTDIVRTDGNEFLIYMVGYDEKKVIDFTRKLSKDLKELPHGFGATLGYSMITDDVKTIDDAINEATLSKRQAKEKL